ncbi:ABC transporter ATP-binding protein [Cryobacterium sp. SO2]|uniref:ABC transporter ATP-binding protein n=1 Tax=Cryobacterium sp. SO2 TaxID=1897060 RepID=UPI00223E5771|nr:ABC transporter ATP-binding protein [Cryobacterium sp. SO2]WEO77312.1 ABC transporter ATP-binding protein [Cryobacterium sp. SO2]
MNAARRRLQTVAWEVSLIAAMGPRRVGVLLIVHGLLAVVPIGLVLAFSGTVAAFGVAGEGRSRATAAAITLLAALLVLQRLLELVAEPVALWGASGADLHSRTRLTQDLVTPVTIDHGETEEVRGHLATVRGDLRGQTPGMAVAAWFSLAVRIIPAAWCVVLIADYSLVAAVFALVLLLFRRWLQQHSFGMVYRSWALVGPAARRFEYWRRFHVDPASAKEIRVFGLSDWSLQRFRDAAFDKFAPVWSGRRAASRWSWPSVAAGLAGALVILLSIALQPGLTAVAVAQLVAAGLTLLRLSEPAGENLTIEQGRRIGTSIRAVRAAASAAVSREGPTGRGNLGTGHPPGVRLEDLRFHYPHDERLVLRGIDLEVPSGSTLAIVGGNGAGKTTLVKLLARLYEPTGGCLSADGIDLRDLDVERWRRRLAIMIQGFVRYELTLRENVQMGAAEAYGDGEFFDRVKSSLGIDDMVSELPLGWDTLLGTGRAGGVGLSGGQWQRVALARAVFAVRAGRDVVVLDEPTSHLDAETEERVLAQIEVLSSAATVIVVSHRLATIRHADQIVVMAEGRILERGTHETLLADHGHYARMFAAQAERYLQPEVVAPAGTSS